METENHAAESQQFQNLDTRHTFASADHAPPTGNKVARLTASEPIGPAMSLAVVPGDIIDLEVYGYYEGGTGFSNTATLNSFTAAVAAAFGGVNGGGGESQSIFDGVNDFFTGLGSLNGTGNDNVPAAYLNYILVDQDYQHVSGGYVQISSAANFNQEQLSLNNIEVAKAGFMYIYVSLESNVSQGVFFDDLKVVHEHSPIVQTDDYYPFGLTYSSYQKTGKQGNKFLYNGFEKQDDWGVYDYQARFFDPVLGRFLMIDPATEVSMSLSSYSYAFNNPVRFVDFDGMVGTEGGGTDPTKLYGKRVDMSGAPGKTNAAGHPRNGPWFWRKMLKEHPEMFSDENVASIKRGRSPIADGKWVEHNPAHANYKGGKLIHHHINQGKMATGIPEAAHKKYFSELHANRGGRPKGRGKLGGAAFGVASFLVDIAVGMEGNPHSMGMQLTEGFSDDKLYYNEESDVYWERSKGDDVTNDAGEVIGSEYTFTYYSDFTKNEETGEYEGTGDKTTVTVTKYEGQEAKDMFIMLRGG
jgi:RHS repeat-associated protein